MAKRTKKQRGPDQPTPKELRRSRRNQQQQRMLFSGTGAVIVAILFILGFGYYRENIAAARAPVAVVSGRAITTQDYQQMVNYQRFSLITTLGGQVQQETLVNFLQNQLPQSVLENMIQQVLIEQYAAEAGITVTNEEVQTVIEEQFGFTGDVPTAAPPAGTAVTTTETTSTLTREEFNTALSNYLKALKEQAGLSESQYRRIIRGQLLRDKVQEQVTADVPTTAHQVHVRHILVETEEEAQQVRQRLLDGEDFAKVAEEVSTDTSTAKDGGDLGWLGLGETAGQYGAEFEKAAFSQPIGAPSEPIQSQFGYHVIEVLERDEDRPLSPVQLDQARQERFFEWLQERQTTADIQRYWTPNVVPALSAALASSQSAPPPPALPTPAP